MHAPEVRSPCTMFAGFGGLLPRGFKSAPRLEPSPKPNRDSPQRLGFGILPPTAASASAASPKRSGEVQVHAVEEWARRLGCQFPLPGAPWASRWPGPVRLGSAAMKQVDVVGGNEGRVFHYGNSIFVLGTEYVGSK